MSENVLFDFVQAIALFFLNPLFIVAIFISVAIGYYRVKRERRSFKIRLLPGLTELKRLLTESWPYALVLSVLISGVGLVTDSGWLVLFSTIALIAVLSFNFKLTSPVYFAAIASLVLYGMQGFADGFSLWGWTPGDANLLGNLAVTIPLIAGMLLIAEGLLIRRHTVHYASPYLTHTNRGLRAVAYKVKRLWLLPIVFLVPGDMISAYVPYWPQFTVGSTAFSFVPVPLIIGFSQVTRALYPDVLFPKMGRMIIWTGFIVIVVGLCALWMPILGWAALLIGVLGRSFVSIRASIHERKGPFAVAPQSTGVVIAGVLPESPAEKMGILPGECIRAVNGRQVANEKELYDAIQINAAHCRLQVVDRNGEVRLMQQVLFHQDHHRLGLLVVK
ncbi:PDZ domain-containing protein [Filibacter tadaridae]|uniref:Cell division topological determinant MinJ n=1 Tax=Filibacter tadaridae TaxID=2483811 RepID=A0A3P5XBG9_9BACL|nr:PDZ domain-containing protein [Filibacter tadaridae]VDC27555.1 Cell division topological determinant MinJ [Filibacter tadaridae]